MENLGFNKERYVFASVPPMLLIGDSAEGNRNKQIALFLNELSSYNVLLKDLISYPIKERDRNIALNIAYYIVNNEDMIEAITRKKDLPISKISKLTKIKPDFLGKCRDYILAYFIILVNPNYKSIQDYFKIKLKEDDKVVNISKKDKGLHKGIAIRINKRSACILTSKGEFLKIKTDSNVKVGEACEGKEKKTFANLRIKISLLLVILIMICSGIVIEYRRTESIIVIQTTSSIKVHINRLNKVIYAHSPTERGKDLIDNVDVLNKNIDDALVDILSYAANNDMLDSNKKVLITVSGQPIKYGLLNKTSKFVDENKFMLDNNIRILINNAGNQQKLPKNLTETEDKK